MTASKITVLVVDDSSFMRSMLPRLIGRDDRFEVVGTAQNGREGVDQTLKLQPDIVTMDIEMPVMDGIAALEEIMEKSPRPVLMVSSLTEAGAQATIDALDKGAVDFIPKALDDQERNVMKMADVLHEKLAAAANSKIASELTTESKEEPPKKAEKEDVQPQISRMSNAKALVIGCSTGGPRALQEIVPQLAADLRVPVLIAQHMPAGFTKAMANRLNETSKIEVCEAADMQKLETGIVYIAPGGQHMRIKKDGAENMIAIGDDKGESLYKPSVDVLAESVLKTIGGSVVAVMLTGMGEDGAENFVSLKKEGAHVIAQDEASSTVYGMPRAVKNKGGASEVLPLDTMVQRISMLLS